MATVKKEAAAPGSTRKALRVVAKREGFRRAGFAFGSEPVNLYLDELSDEQEALLRSETMLVVVDVDMVMPVPVAGQDLPK